MPTSTRIAPHTSALAGLLCLFATACSDVDHDEELRATELSCPRWQCGYNTSEVNGKSLQELNLQGLANDDGLRLVGFLPPAGLLLDYTLGVEGDALVARGGLFGNSTLRGAQLVGGTILLQDGLLTIPVVIAAYEQVDSWASNGQPVAAYSLVYVDLDGLQRSVCSGSIVNLLEASVVVLAGERYDNDSKTVIPNQNGWITLGCAGSASAKLSLLGYGPNASFTDNSPTPSVAQRQATLKMITADYCGTGHSYTEGGTPLAYENNSGTVTPYYDEYGPMEAIWTSSGALCLDVPRLVAPEDVACSLPSCDTFALANGEWATYVVE